MDSKIRVTFVINNLSGGGAERVLINILNNIDRNRFIPRLFLFEYKGEYLNSLSRDVEVGFSNKCTSLAEGRSKFFTEIKKQVYRYTIGARELSEYIKDDDCVVAFLEKMSTYVLGKVLKKNSKISYSWIHTNVRDFSFIHKALSKEYYKYFNNIFCVSNECAELAKKEFSEFANKIECLYNPVDIMSIVEKAQKETTYKMPSGVNVVAIGRLTRQKAFDTLIKAFSLVKIDNINLIILGEGEDRRYLEGLIKEYNIEEKVYLPGFIDNPFSILKNADLFVLSSRVEGLPTVLIEALALNKNIVATKCSGSREILLGDKEYGYIANIDDVVDLSNKITKALLNPKINNGFIRAMDFDKSNIIKSLEERLTKDLCKEKIYESKCNSADI